MNHKIVREQLPLTRGLWILMSMALLHGCSSAKFIQTGSYYPARPDDCDLQIFSSKLPDRAYEELGILEGEGSFGADTLEKILPKMRREACRAGGDAIILTSTQKSVDVQFYTDSADEQLNVVATVVRWTD